MLSPARQVLLRSAARQHVIASAHVARSARRASTTLPHRADYKPFQPSVLPDAKRPGKLRRTVAPYILSFLAAGIGFYITQLYVAAHKSCPDPSVRELAAQTDVAARYDETADKFDSEVGASEMLMGINSDRRKLSQKCKGHVLEVSCGTGRNLGYYDVTPKSEIESLTLVDLSAPMVNICKKKWLALYGPTSGTPKKTGLVVRFLTGSALAQMPDAPGGKQYDTIIQTMGLCSTPEPVRLLENISRHLNAFNPDARILLLEHGRSYRDWLNNILDNSAAKHAEVHGCWFNRDIGALVEDAAAKCGLEMVSKRRRHLGTTWIYELRLKSATQHPVAVGEPQAAEKTVYSQPAPTQRSVPAESAEDALSSSQDDTEAAKKGTYGWRGLLRWN